MSETQTTTDPFATWRSLLKGDGAADMNDPAPGYYLVRLSKGGPLVPVAIEPDGLGGCNARTPFSDSADMERIWPYAANTPKTYEDFLSLWNDWGRNDRPAKGEDDIDALIAEVSANLPMRDAAQESALADALHLLKAAADSAEAARKEAEAPLKERLAEIAAEFQAPKEAADAARKDALAAIAKHLQKTGKDGVKGRYGKKISLRTREECRIVDPGAFLDHILETNRPAVVEAVAKALRGKAVAGAPGVEVVEKVSAQ